MGGGGGRWIDGGGVGGRAASVKSSLFSHPAPPPPDLIRHLVENMSGRPFNSDFLWIKKQGNGLSDVEVEVQYL